MDEGAKPLTDKVTSGTRPSLQGQHTTTSEGLHAIILPEHGGPTHVKADDDIRACWAIRGRAICSHFPSP